MLVEAFLVAVHNILFLRVLYSEGVVWWLANTGRVHNSNGLVELGLVPKLVVQVNRGEEDVVLRMGVDPTERDNGLSHLYFE